MKHKRVKRYVVLLLVFSMILVGCGDKHEESELETDAGKQQEQTADVKMEEVNWWEGQPTLEGTIWFSQNQKLAIPASEEGFGGWTEGVLLTRDYVYFFYQLTNCVEKELLLYRVPLQEIFSENIVSGNYPEILAIEATEQLELPEDLEDNLMEENPTKERIIRFWADEQGMLYLVTAQWISEEEKLFYLYQCDEDMQVQEKREITESLQGFLAKEDEFISTSPETHTAVIDREGRIYLVNTEVGKLWVLDKEGVLLHTIMLPREEFRQLAVSEAGKVTLLTGSEEGSKLYSVDGENGEVSLLENMSETIGNGFLLTGNKDTLLYGDTGYLYAYDLEKNTKEELIKWNDYYVSGSSVIAARRNTDGRCYILEEDRSLTLFEPVNGTTLPAEKKQVTLAAILVPDFLSSAVVEFNKRNPYYEVVIEEYEFQEGQQKLEMELATGRGPDLFKLDMVYVDKLVKNDLIEDLSPYLEDGKGLEREELVESVLRCNTISGVLTCVPPKFTLSIMLGKPAVVGEDSSWTVEEYLEAIRQHEGVQILSAPNDDIARYSIVTSVLDAELEHFIDWESHKASFDSEEFKELLELAKNYKMDTFDYDNRELDLLDVQDGRQLLIECDISSVWDYMIDRAALQQEAQFVGYPTYDGRTSYGILNFVPLGINADSQVKDGAWAFIEFMMTYRLTDPMFDTYGFYTRETALAYQLVEGTYKAYEHDADWNILLDAEGNAVEAPKFNRGNNRGKTVVEAYAATEKDIADLRVLIDEAEYVNDISSNDIYTIVSEEVLTYIRGTRSVEETVSVIQNRVQLYLDEVR